jgi:EAL domain-containing protein (putative c-di-GMP-specific phosphodiesterase class I)
LRRLRAAKCGEVQGYLFGRPCPAGEVQALCRTLTQLGLVETAA